MSSFLLEKLFFCLLALLTVHSILAAGYNAGKGPEGRMLGSLVSLAGDVPLLVTTFVAAWTMISSEDQLG